jgi:hypothetical protein
MATSTGGKAGVVSEWKTSGWMRRAVSIAEKYFRPVGSNRSSSDQIRDAVFVEVGHSDTTVSEIRRGDRVTKSTIPFPGENFDARS